MLTFALPMPDIEKILPAALLEAMDRTEQNPVYHAEGNVLKHTRMVAEKVAELASNFTLTESEREALQWAAVLHDVGKVETTQWQDNRWRSPGHEKAGVPIARDIMLNHQVPLALRQQVLGLVRWHGFPLRFERNHWPEASLQSLGTITELKLLSIFSIMDFHGRISEDFEATLQRVNDFHSLHAPKAEYEMGTYASLQEAWKNWSVQYKNAAWRAISLRKPALIPKLAEQNPPITEKKTLFSNRKIYLTIGAPLSGKTTWLKENMPDAFTVQLLEHNISEAIVSDEFLLNRRIVELRYLLEGFLRHHDTIVFEGRNLHPVLRHRLSEAFRDMGVQLTWLVFEETLEVLRKRNAESTSPMPDETLVESHKHLGVFHPWDAHEIVFVRG
jgi:putative nucleotidyltransferase with HDIG domain